MNFLNSLLMLLWITLQPPLEQVQTIGTGIHPAVGTDPAGRVHVVFGRGQTIWYATSTDGKAFSTPVMVDSLPGLHLGASRGPQIAATNQSVVITAINKAGNVKAYTLDRATGRWLKSLAVTDVPDVAKEGFVALAAGPNNSYNALWLDLRGNQHNKLAGARSLDGGRTWSKNEVLYQSPDGTICECCQPSMASRGRDVAIMFRNFLAGSRDMYLLKSTDGGQTFGKAEKMGEGTWKLNACPMDGGGLFMAQNGAVSTVWRRADKLFTARPQQPEVEIGVGKNARIVTTGKGDYVVFQRDGQVWAISPGKAQPESFGEGAYPKLTLLPNDKVLCLWEQAGTVRAGFIQ